MVRGERLLRLYPRAWRERYGDEFLATLEPGRLRPRDVIDIVAGAIDARFSAEVRRAALSHRAVRTGGAMSMMKCLAAGQQKPMPTTRDSMIGAAVMIAASLVLSFLGLAVRREGWHDASEVILGFSFPASLTLSMPFWLMAGQPRQVKVAIVGGTLAILTAIGYVTVLL